MFQSIVFKNQINPGRLIDIGALAEALIFYGNVSIVANIATIEDLLKQIPSSEVLSLISSGRLKIYYLDDQVAISSQPIKTVKGKLEEYSLVKISSPNHSIENIPRRLKETVGDTGKTASDARKIAKLLKPIAHKNFDQKSLINTFCDQNFIQPTVQKVLEVLVPEYGLNSSFRFSVEQGKDEKFYVDTNLDFEKLNDCYHKIVSVTHSSFTPAYILALIQSSYEDSYIAAVLNSEIVASPISKVIQEQTIQSIVSKHINNSQNIGRFIDQILPNANAIREAINSGKVSYAQLQSLLDKADKFRSWIQNKTPDSNIIQCFYEETIRETFIEKLPVKAMKWVVFTGIGFLVDEYLSTTGLGPTGGILLSAVDAFILDKLMKGWKPHQFIENDLKPLFDSK